MSAAMVDDEKNGRGASLVMMAEMEGKGRALVASQPLRAGQVILRDSPILLYSVFHLITPTSPRQPEQKYHSYCAHCFRIIQPSNSSSSVPPIPCFHSTSCSAVFCSPSCRATALTSSHSAWVCQSLIRLQDCPSSLLQKNQDRQFQACFLVAAYNLAFVSPSDFRTLLSLQGDSTSLDEAASFLHSLISSLCPLPDTSGFSLELTSALLAKDKLNAFGLMEPFAEDRERSVRAYGIYPRASFFNHDCLPNACRYDYVDAALDNRNTDIIVRVIHEVPQGRELCLSYFQVNLKYKDRQRRLREDYGFICDCDRCKVEATWSDDDEEELNDNDEYEGKEAMDEDNDEQMEETEDVGEEDSGEIKGDTDFPHAYFFLRYMCNRNNCWGTLAPLPPSHYGTTQSNVMECNVCGSLKSNEEIIDG